MSKSEALRDLTRGGAEQLTSLEGSFEGRFRSFASFEGRDVFGLYHFTGKMCFNIWRAVRAVSWVFRYFRQSLLLKGRERTENTVLFHARWFGFE
jgi:hypothetical protein